MPRPGGPAVPAVTVRLRPTVELTAALLVAAGVVGLGAHALVFQVTLPSRLPSASDWRAVSEALAHEARPGDAVALSPWWAERARQALPERLPIVAVPTLAGEELVGVRRLWVLALPRAPGQRAPLERELADRAGPASQVRAFGGISLALHTIRRPLLPLAFLPAQLAGASVTAGGAPCVADGRGGFRCPGGAGRARITAETREVGDAPRRCVLASPAGGRPVPIRVEFPAVPVGRSLRVHAGPAGEPPGGDEPPTRVAVALDGREVGALEVIPGRAPEGVTWQGLALDTAGLAGSTRSLALTLASPGAGARPLCFDAYTLP